VLSSAEPAEEACTDPSHDHSLDFRGERGLQTSFRAGAFVEGHEDGSDSNGASPAPAQPPSGRAAASAKLRAPVHTCRMKQTPGLKLWIAERAPLFAERVTVQAFSQPPSLWFYDAEGDLIEHVGIHESATAADISGLLRSRGIRSLEADAADLEDDVDSVKSVASPAAAAPAAAEPTVAAEPVVATEPAVEPVASAAVEPATAEVTTPSAAPEIAQPSPPAKREPPNRKPKRPLGGAKKRFAPRPETVKFDEVKIDASSGVSTSADSVGVDL